MYLRVQVWEKEYNNPGQTYQMTTALYFVAVSTGAKNSMRNF